MSTDESGWRRAGITADARRSFQEWNISLDDAIKWHQAGVSDGLTATRWKIARIAPAGVADWRAAGIESVEALHWCELGHDLETAKRNKANGVSPGQTNQNVGVRGRAGAARSTGITGPNGERAGPAFEAWLNDGQHLSRTTHFYLISGWISDEALPWAKADVPPDSAKIWMTLGVRPREAVRLEKGGVKATDVVREWWAAGVPLELVAVWLGAGFTAAEAAEQIAAGVTPEQAAVLRALRDDDDHA